MSKKNRSKQKGMPIEKKSTTFLPPTPSFRVTPMSQKDTKQAELAEKFANYMLQSMMYGGNAGACASNAPVENKKSGIEVKEKVHSSYDWDKEKQAFISVDGLALHVSDCLAAPYLPGFALVCQGDPLALYCIGNYWYTPAAGKNSLEILAEHFAKRVAEQEDQWGGSPFLRGFQNGQNIPTQHQWQQAQAVQKLKSAVDPTAFKSKHMGVFIDPANIFIDDGVDDIKEVSPDFTGLEKVIDTKGQNES